VIATSTRDRLDRPTFFIGGKWVEPRGKASVEALEAATGEVLGTAALGSEADIAAAVSAARDAFDYGPWGRSTIEERAGVLDRMADALERRAKGTSELVSRENGMPISVSGISNGVAPVRTLRYNAELIRATQLEEVRPSALGATTVRREPIGVVGAITPWNFPQVNAMFKVGPALAAGCTVVLKPSPETSLDPYILGEAAEEAGLPPGVLNIVVAGREAGSTLVTHPGVNKIAFTGSTAAGRLIGAECGRLIRPVTLELGGKSASIVLDDADLDLFVNGLDGASLRNNGQTCTNQTRILAPRSRYAEVVETVTEYARGLNVGNPLDPSVTCGPMVSEAHRRRVLTYIEQGKRSDARLTTGGGVPADQPAGWFVEPTVFADVANGDVIAREEIFGPVLVVIPYEGDDEAVEIANDSNYGLAGSVWTADQGRGMEVARRIQTGTIGVNYYTIDGNAPFGGVKDSGLGREMGPEGLAHYFQYKSIYHA
jgi:acyl-CoA reductase-like NAD-dependent aldehyde dehydrogenase